MKNVSRGEQSFLNLPKIGAKLYNRLTGIEALRDQTKEIAIFLSQTQTTGKILDIGTGPGRLLKDLHLLNSELKLYGLDISISMISQAKSNLKDIGANLQQGNIRTTPYSSNFFDVVTCTGSFYLWDSPIESLNEIHRILKSGSYAYLFETYKDYDENDFLKALKENLKNESFFSKKLSPRFLKRQLNMTYSLSEFEELFKESKFSQNFAIYKIKLSNLPIWIRIELYKN